MSTGIRIAGYFPCADRSQRASANSLEAALVRAGVENLSPDVRADVVRRARRIAAESARAFPGDAAAGILDPDRTEEADDAYFEVIADRACPMLDLPSGSCRI